MSNAPYFDQDTCDDIQRAADSGKSPEDLAGQVGITVEELCRLMGWPQWKPTPAATGGAEFDLFACDRLDAQL
jgi:hypothetical protein